MRWYHVAIAFAVGALVVDFIASPRGTYSSCSSGAPVNGRVLVGATAPLMRGPSHLTGQVLNERATKFLERNNYRDVSPELDLEGLCETTDWILVKIVGADGRKVSWESGWVEKKHLVKELSQERKAGLYWDISKDKSVPDADKTWVYAQALKVLSNDKNCERVISGGPAFGHPETYFVMCKGVDSFPYNVKVRKQDIQFSTRSQPSKPRTP